MSIRPPRYQLLALILCLASGVACTRSPQKRIVGEWKEVNEDTTMQFFPDGTIVVLNGGTSTAGTYSFPDESHLKIQDAKEVNIFVVTIADNTFSITLLNSSPPKTIVFERIHTR